MIEALTFGLSEFAEGTSEQTYELTARDLDLEPVGASITGPIAIDLVFVRTRDEFQVNGTARVAVEQGCVRCLSPVATDLRVDLLILVRPRETRGPSEELPQEGVVIHDREKFSLGHEVREAILVEITPHPLCRPDCQGLCPQCGGNLNDKKCDCPADGLSDPRWAALSKLKSKPDEDPENN